MGKKMTLEDVRDWLRSSQALMKGYDDKASACYKERADAIDVHLATPAQAVDVEKICNFVMDGLLSRQVTYSYLRDKLSQAIGDKP